MLWCVLELSQVILKICEKMENNLFVCLWGRKFFYYTEERWLILLLCLHPVGYMSVKSPINFSLHLSLCKIQILIFISSNISIILWRSVTYYRILLCWEKSSKSSQSTIIIIITYYFMLMAKAIIHVYGNQNSQIIL